MLNKFQDDLQTKKLPPRKRMVKKGTLDIDVVEATPVVWKGRLYRFEWIRNSDFGPGYYNNPSGTSHFRFTDMETEESTPPFGENCFFGSAHIEGDTAYVYGVHGMPGGQRMDVYCSKNLVDWERRTAFTLPDRLNIFNNTVCKGKDGYYMAIELNGDPEAIGKPFTIVFAKSPDLLCWELMEMGSHIYTRARYSACPTLRYSPSDERYYMIYLESLPCHRYLPYIVRTEDFVHFELGHKNPIMFADDEDKEVQRPEKFTASQLEYIRNAINCNNSDVDLCDFDGKTIILYSWGNQLGKEFLAEAEYDGTMDEFLHSFFAD